MSRVVTADHIEDRFEDELATHDVDASVRSYKSEEGYTVLIACRTGNTPVELKMTLRIDPNSPRERIDELVRRNARELCAGHNELE
jgi:hypothetical protein